MIGNSNSENNSSEKNGRQQNLDRLEEQLSDKLRETADYVAKMSDFVPEPEPFPLGAYTLSGDSTNSADLPYDPRISYYHEFWKIYVRNENRLNQIKVLASESTVLREKLTEIERLHKDVQSQAGAASGGLSASTKKKNRRLAADIDKRFRCPYDNCYKLYGSNVSLNLHIKLKHNGGNKTDRQKIAQQICMAEISKTPMPAHNITFPPGFLEAYRKEFLRTLKKEIRC